METNYVFFSISSAAFHFFHPSALGFHFWTFKWGPEKLTPLEPAKIEESEEWVRFG
jgi:hypothetical protein